MESESGIDIRIGDRFLSRNGNDSFGIFEVIALAPSQKVPIFAVIHSIHEMYGLKGIAKCGNLDLSEIKARYSSPFVTPVTDLLNRGHGRPYTKLDRGGFQRLLFGPTLDLEKESDAIPVPVNAPCAYCEEYITANDFGTLIWHMDENPRYCVYHRDCFLRQIFGSLKHQKEECSCHGGTDDAPDMTKRQEAEAACKFWREHNGK